MKNLKKFIHEYSLTGVIFLTMLILTIFNRFKMDDFGNPDAEVELVFARAIWREKSLFPVEWIHSTEPQNLKPSMITSLFWGITHNMQLAHTITLLIMMILAFFSFYYMCTAITNLKKTSILLGFEVLLGGFGMDFMRLYFVIDGRYCFIMFSIFLLAGYVLRAKDGIIRKKDTILLACLFFGLGIVGPRSLMYTFLPFFVASIFFFIGSEKWEIGKDFFNKNKYWTALFIQVLANVLGFVLYIIIFSKSDKVPADTTKAMWISAYDFFSNLTIGLVNCLRIIGIYGNEKLISLNGIDILIKLALIVLCLYYVFAFSKKHCSDSEKYLISIMGCGAVWAWILSSTLSLTGNGSPQNQTWYYYYIVYSVVVILTIFINYLSVEKVLCISISIIVPLIVCVNLLANNIMNYEYQGRVAEKKVAAILVGCDAKYVYAPYNTAYTIEQVSEEKIEAVSLLAIIDNTNADIVDVWLFNLNTDAAKNAIKEDEFFLVLTDTENNYMVENKNSAINRSECELLTVVDDNYYIYKFNEYPFYYLR